MEHPTLSPRQRLCLALAARGLSDRQIAAQVGVTPRTVGHHLGNAYAKLLAHNRRDAAATAQRLGLLGNGEQ